ACRAGGPLPPGGASSRSDPTSHPAPAAPTPRSARPPATSEPQKGSVGPVPTSQSLRTAIPLPVDSHLPKFATIPTRGRGAERPRRVMNEIVPTHNIGSYVPMVDGPEKGSGRATYNADLINPGMLAGRIVRSPYSHAEIIDVDVSAALQLPGVKAIVTGADCDKTFGVLPIARSEHHIARDKVRYRGEPVAAVAAVDDATAKRAIALIKLTV